MREPVTFALEAPISFAGQETMTHLTVKPFRGKDLLKCGMPFSVKRDAKGNETEVVDVQSITMLLAHMNAVPPTMIGELEALDFQLATGVLRQFFFYSTRQKSSSDSSPPESGAETTPSSST